MAGRNTVPAGHRPPWRCRGYALPDSADPAQPPSFWTDQYGRSRIHTARLCLRLPSRGDPADVDAHAPPGHGAQPSPRAEMVSFPLWTDARAEADACYGQAVLPDAGARRGESDEFGAAGRSTSPEAAWAVRTCRLAAATAGPVTPALGMSDIISRYCMSPFRAREPVKCQRNPTTCPSSESRYRWMDPSGSSSAGSS